MFKPKSLSIKALLLIAASMIFIQTLAYGEEPQKPDWKLDSRYDRTYDSNGRNLQNIDVFFGFKDLIYFNLKTDLQENWFNWLVIGGYINLEEFSINPEIRIRNNDWTIKCVAEKVLGGPLVGQFMLSATLNSELAYFPMMGFGLYYYFGDYHYAYCSMLVCPRGIIWAAKLHLESSNRLWWWDVKAEINNFGDPGIFTQMGFGIIYAEFGYWHNFDYQQFDRIMFGSGLKVNF